MTYTLLHIAVVTGTILTLAKLLPGVRVKSMGSAAVVAVVFSLVNWGVGWAIHALLFIPALLTLGLLFLFIPFIVNTVALWITDKFLDAFHLADLKALLISAGTITLVNAALHIILR